MNKLEYVARSLSRGTNKKYETYVINAIYQKVNNPNLEIETQKVIKLKDGYSPLIDLYLPQLKIAIEVDELYHDNERQRSHDLWREDSINSQIHESCVGDSIRFERVKVSIGDLESLNNRIDELVSYIKEKINNRSEPLVWLSEDEKLEEIKRRGTIEVDDCFDNNAQIINIVFGKNYKGWRKACYKCLWFPVISDMADDNSITDRRGWQNFFNQTKTIIYERSISKQTNESKKEWSIIDLKNKATRIVFVRDKDSFGVSRKRFAGVFQAGGWDDNKQAEIWKLKSTEIAIPIRE